MVDWLTGFSVAFCIVVIALVRGWLTKDGAFAAVIVGTVVYAVWGVTVAIPLIWFFLSSSLLSRIQPKRKQRFKEIFDKGATRDAGQVLANGGAALVFAAWAILFPNEQLWIAGALGAIATAAADTWGTEIGTLSRMRPRSILTWQQVDTGTSGGISTAGTVAGLLGSFTVVLSAHVLVGLPFTGIVLITLGGFLGMLVDSLLGATVQAQYQCVECRTVTECITHCGHTTEKLAGRTWCNNDMVNWGGTLAGGIISLIFTSFIN
jgi:uncharacterized protein (TIGR00297 family)